MKHLINEDIQTMKYLFGYKPGKVLSEQGTPSISTATPSPTPTAAAAAPSTPEEVIKQIQTILNTPKYGAKLTVDGKWGNLTQTAFEAAVKNIKPATPAAAGTTPPAAAGTTPVVATKSDVMQTGEKVSDVEGLPSTNLGPSKADDIIDDQPQSNRDQRRARQDLRRGNKRAMQDLKTQQRAQQ
jgi:hypothetical protein